MSVTPAVAARPAVRSSLKAVGLPAEHGGWGLTLEPGLLGLLVAPSVAGLCLVLAGLVAFLARTPLRIAAVDRRRGRVLARTRLARRLAIGELALLALLVTGATAWGGARWWVPALAAAPFFAVEAWFEVRSHGRRLFPELAGGIGVCALAAMVVLAGGHSGRLAVGAWAVLAARVTTSIPFVRAQIDRLRDRPPLAGPTVAGDVVAVGLAALAVALRTDLAAGAVAVLVAIGGQRASARRPVPRAVVLGLRQMVLGLAVVVVAALGVLLLAPN